MSPVNLQPYFSKYFVHSHHTKNDNLGMPKCLIDIGIIDRFAAIDDTLLS